MFPSTKYKAKLVSSTSLSQWDATKGSHFHPLLLHLTEGKSSPAGRACWGWAQHRAGLRVPWERGGEQPPKPPAQLQGLGCAGQSPGPGLALGLDLGLDGERGSPLSPGTSCLALISAKMKNAASQGEIFWQSYTVFRRVGFSSGQGNSPQKVETHHHHFYQRADFSPINADGKFTSSVF